MPEQTVVPEEEGTDARQKKKGEQPWNLQEYTIKPQNR